MCYFCGEEFASRESLQSHHTDCSMIPPPEAHQDTPNGDPSPKAAQSQLLTSEELPAQSLQSMTKASVSYERSLSGDLWAWESPRRHPIKRSFTPPRTPDTPKPNSALVKISKTKYLAGFELLPIQKARCVSERRRSTQCESIDLDEETLPSPLQLRTPKLLISHLSRDESSTSSADPARSCMRSLFSSQSNKIDEDVQQEDEKNKDKEERGLSDESGKVPDRLRNVKSLFNIAISSPLGQCVMKHFKGDPSLHILSDIESHCLTELSKKKELSSRLRERHPLYPITFRGYMKNRDLVYFHKYNFTRNDKMESLWRIKTGLDRKSRVLCRKMRKCKVHIKRLTKADMKLWMPWQNHITVDLNHLTPQEITYWMSSKPMPVLNQPAVFPNGLSLTSPNLNKVLGLRTTEDKNQSLNPVYQHLSVANFVSEEVSAEVTQNRRSVLNSVLSDSIDKGEIKKGPYSTRRCSHQHGAVKFPTLQRLLSGSGEGGGKVRTLPDITNLGPADRCSKTLSVRLDHLDLENKPGRNSDGKRNGSVNGVEKVRTRRRTTFDNSSRLSAIKSTCVRLAYEGAQIFGCETDPSHSSSNDSTDIPVSSARPNLSASNLDGSCSGSYVSRKLRTRSCIRRAPVCNLTNRLHASSSSNQTKGCEKVKLDNKFCGESILTGESTPYPVCVKKTDSDLKSSLSSHNFAVSKSHPALSDLKFKKRLLKAGLVWRASNTSHALKDQSKKVNRKILVNSNNVHAMQNSKIDTIVRTSGPKEGTHRAQSRAGGKRSRTVPERCIKRVDSISSSLSTVPSTCDKQLKRATHIYRANHTDGLVLSKPQIFTHTQHFYRMPSRDKQGRFIASRKQRQAKKHS